MHQSICAYAVLVWACSRLPMHVGITFVLLVMQKGLLLHLQELRKLPVLLQTQLWLVLSLVTEMTWFVMQSATLNLTNHLSKPVPITFSNLRRGIVYSKLLEVAPGDYIEWLHLMLIEWWWTADKLACVSNVLACIDLRVVTLDYVSQASRCHLKTRVSRMPTIIVLQLSSRQMGWNWIPAD